MIEYAQGNDGVLLQKEVYVYLLDSLLMFTVTILFAVYHPSRVLVQHIPLDSEVNLPGGMDSYQMMGRDRADTGNQG
jgi:hypothetical protein